SASTRLAAVENALRDRSRATREKLPPHRLFTIQKQESRRLARNVHETTLKYLRKKNYRTHDGGIKTAPFHVLRRSG
ncbi:N-acetylmuramoyl-L-alanine amidase, partial [Bilophila wadsworthia]|nr:N-acetylmuramoyl-L-alanine amidase [Bilophila wadsworthia]